MRSRNSSNVEEFSSTAVFITPMLDMAFQILAFFVFTYNPSALEGQFPITLAAGQEGGDNPVTTPEAPANPRISTEVRPSVTVVARANRLTGHLVSLEVRAAGRREIIKGPEGAEDEPIDRLLARLEIKLLGYRGADERLLLQASHGLRWEEAMMVMDSCRQTSQLYALQQEGRLQQQFPNVRLARMEKLFPKIEMDLIRTAGSQ